MSPLKQMINRLQEENNILKKNLDSNPLVHHKHLQILELQQQLKTVQDTF
jgi:hypothetical protein